MALIRDLSLKNWPHLFIKTKELADISHLSQSTIRKAIKKGFLPAKKRGSDYFIKIADAQRYIGSTGETKA